MSAGGEWSLSNPFATRWVRPGAVEFHFAALESLAQVVERLTANGDWGEIVGPHGSGKSTLLLAVAQALEQRGRRVVLVELHDGQRWLPIPLAELSCDPNTTICVDGYEQLSRWNAWRLRRHVRRAGAGLLVTSHQPVGLPRLYDTSVSLELAMQLVMELAVAHQGIIEPRHVADAYSATGGNLREMFFKLYDLVEEQRRKGAKRKAEN